MAFSAQPPVYAVAQNTNNSRGDDDIQLRASLETAVMEAVKRGVASEMEVKQVELECLEAVGADLEVSPFQNQFPIHTAIELLPNWRTKSVC